MHINILNIIKKIERFGIKPNDIKDCTDMTKFPILTMKNIRGNIT